jgi:predicted RNA-binding Zn-ribbon protein involved in translation (DUF1610 family)
MSKREEAEKQDGVLCNCHHCGYEIVAYTFKRLYEIMVEDFPCPKCGREFTFKPPRWS